MQPLAWDDHGTLRFKANRIVRDMLDLATKAGIMDMNTIAIDAQLHGKYTREEQQQFAQLIGYSLTGYSELRQYVTDGAWDRAVALPVPKKPRKKKGARDGK
jgi:hypothetical protein